MVFLIVMVGWLFSLTLHEYFHARVALAGGDWTVRDKGYLSFNPIRYMDPMMSIILPMVFALAGGIGLPGGAVYIRHDLLRSRRWSTLVSIAGPIANVLCAFACVAPFALGFAPRAAGEGDVLWPAIAYLGRLQVMAVVFNLVPIPPLDGFGAIEPYLARGIRAQLGPIYRYGFLAFIAALWFLPTVNGAFFGIINNLTDMLGIPAEFWMQGRDSMRSIR